MSGQPGDLFGSLRVVTGRGVGTVFDIPSSTEVRIGRDASANAIVVNDPRVSASHAKIKFDKGSFQIHDLGSGNGTFVNGVVVAGSKTIGNQDKIQIGDTAFLFQVASA